jgi:hypothetical protein
MNALLFVLLQLCNVDTITALMNVSVGETKTLLLSINLINGCANASSLLLLLLQQQQQQLLLLL